MHTDIYIYIHWNISYSVENHIVQYTLMSHSNLLIVPRCRLGGEGGILAPAEARILHLVNPL